MSYPSKPGYKISNWRSCNQALKQRGSLTVWFDESMEWDARPSGKRGRQQIYSDAAIQACLTLKVLFGLPLRQIEPGSAMVRGTLARGHGELFGFIGSVLVGARLQHIKPVTKHAECGDPMPCKRGPAPLD